VAGGRRKGGPPGAATDIHSRSCPAVETLSGTVPYERDTDAAIMYAHIVDPPPRVSERRPELPRAPAVRTVDRPSRARRSRTCSPPAAGRRGPASCRRPEE